MGLRPWVARRGASWTEHGGKGWMGDDGAWVCEIVELGLKGHGTAGGGPRDVEGLSRASLACAFILSLFFCFWFLCFLG